MSSTNNPISRRSFLAGASALGAIAGISALSGCATQKVETVSEAEPVQSATWDASYDVVVVGCGFAGMTAAITAANEGASVAIVDSAPEEYAGGNSRVCGQLIWCCEDTDLAKKYFYDINEGYTDDIPETMVDAFLEEIAANKAWVEDEIGIELKAWPYPEYKISEFVKAAESTLHPADGMGNGQLWNPMLEHVQDLGVDVFYNHRAKKFALDDNGVISGVLIDADGAEKAFEARLGVAMCCGGFENNETMKKNYIAYAGRPIGSPYNKGDGHAMCQAIGADLWHMHTAMIPTGFDLKDVEVAGFEDNVVHIATSVAGGPIWIDKYGNRFMDESRDPQHGLGHSAVLWEDSNKLETPRIPLWVVTDGQQMDEGSLFVKSGWLSCYGAIPALDELLSSKHVLKADTIEELAALMDVPVESLSASLTRYNEFANAGQDQDFGRKPETMRVLEAPFYALKAYPGLLNTDGGPRRNEHGQILDVWGDPIPKLYSAGEFGSIWPHHYQGAGNVGECLAFGRIIGKNLANES